MFGCLAKQQTPQFSLKPFADLVPPEKDVFIRPVHASQQSASGAYGGYGYRTGELCVAEQAHRMYMYSGTALS